MFQLCLQYCICLYHRRFAQSVPSKGRVASMFVKTYENILEAISDVQNLAQETRIAAEIFRKQSQTYMDDIQVLEKSHASALQNLQDSKLLRGAL